MITAEHLLTVQGDTACRLQLPLPPSTPPPKEYRQSGQEDAPGHVPSFCIISGMDEHGTEARRGAKGGREFKENSKGW